MSRRWFDDAGIREDGVEIACCTACASWVPLQGRVTKGCAECGNGAPKARKTKPVSGPLFSGVAVGSPR